MFVILDSKNKVGDILNGKIFDIMTKINTKTMGSNKEIINICQNH